MTQLLGGWGGVGGRGGDRVINTPTFFCRHLVGRPTLQSSLSLFRFRSPHPTFWTPASHYFHLTLLMPAASLFGCRSSHSFGAGHWVPVLSRSLDASSPTLLDAGRLTLPVTDPLTLWMPINSHFGCLSTHTSGHSPYLRFGPKPRPAGSGPKPPDGQWVSSSQTSSWEVAASCGWLEEVCV